MLTCICFINGTKLHYKKEMKYGNKELNVNNPPRIKKKFDQPFYSWHIVLY